MARGYSNVKFEWNNSASVIVRNKGFGKGLNKDSAQILYETYYPYIPYSLQSTGGNLANNVRITANDDHGTITHLVRYANRQFNADAGNADGVDVLVHRTRMIHELATSHWSDWAWSVHKKEITARVDEARKKYIKPTRLSSSARIIANRVKANANKLVSMLMEDFT